MGNIISKFGQTIIPLIIIGFGLLFGSWFFMNPDEAKKGDKPPAQALLVETSYPEHGTYPAIIEATGQVQPAIEATLRPQISGEILLVDKEFIPGGHFIEGNEILMIDPTDYELIVNKQKAVLSQAQADYDLEMGRQSVARDELKILERTTGRKPDSPDLALRKPQLEQAKAEVEKAKSDLETAELDLARTRITAPFNALITSRDVNTGDKVSNGETLATLVNTDEYWLSISVPVKDLQWIEIPRRSNESGSVANIILDSGRGERQGHVLRLTGSLDTSSRLARILISIPDPLLLQENNVGTPLILGDYARVIIEGKKLKDVSRINLSWLHDNNTIWVKENGKLTYKTVNVIYEDREYAYINEGLSPQDEIVTSDIAVPVEQMRIRTSDEKVQNKTADEVKK